MSGGGLPPGVAGRRRAAWPEVRTLCVWLPQLPLRVEVLRHPAWDGRPLVLGGPPGGPRVVRLCSPEAERAGIRPGLPLREVLPLCREAIVLQPDPVRIAAVLDEAVVALQRLSPAVEPAEEQLFLDLRGLQALYGGDLEAVERAVRAAISPLLGPRIGAAGGKFGASVAARLAPHATMRVVPARDTAAFLAPLPVRHLPLDPETLRRLDLLGLHTLGALAALPVSALQAEFGPPGARAWRLAHGRDDEPIVPRRFPPTVRAVLRCDDPLGSVEAILVALDRLLAQLFADPALRGRSVRQALLRALLGDGTSWERLVTFKEALSAREPARRALWGKLRLPNGLPPAPVEELSLELQGLGGEAAKQPGLFAARAGQLGQIAEVARQLRARYGHIPLYRVVEVEPWSRIPERRWALVPCDL